MIVEGRRERKGRRRVFGSEEGTSVRRKKHRRLVITRTIILTSKQPEKGVVKAVVVLAFSFSSRAKKNTHTPKDKDI